MIKFFSAGWCTPCQNMKRELGDDVLSTLDQVDVDAEPDEVKTYGISSIPTFIKFNDEGEEIDRKRGSMSKTEFLAWLDE